MKIAANQDRSVIGRGILFRQLQCVFPGRAVGGGGGVAEMKAGGGRKQGEAAHQAQSGQSNAARNPGPGECDSWNGDEAITSYEDVNGRFATDTKEDEN